MKPMMTHLGKAKRRLSLKMSLVWTVVTKSLSVSITIHF